MKALLSPNDVILECGRHCETHPFNPPNWKNFYFDTIKNLKPGLTELIIHLAHDDAEMQAVIGR